MIPARPKSDTSELFSKITRDHTERRNHEEALRQSEEHLGILIESISDYAIFMLDLDGRVASWNAGAERIKGYRADEIIGKHFSIFYPPEVVESGWPEHELQVAVKDGRFEDEGWRIRKDKSRFWANVIITPLHDPDNRVQGFAKITRDLTVRRKMEALQEATNQMNVFLAMLAHELRNPLAPIRNAVSIMESLEIDDSNLAWIRDVIGRQVSSLSRLVDDLLDISRIMTGKITLNRQAIDVNDVVTRAIETAQPLITRKRHSLEVMTPPEATFIEGDDVRLVQAVLNLLNNAARYTPEGGQIRVAVESDEESVTIRVKDNGIGIPPELLPRVFDLFRQGEQPIDRHESGLGIGLTLVQRITALHDGSVVALSLGLNRGSEFQLRLPRSRTAPGYADADTGTTTLAPTRRRRILVVDDSRDSVEGMAMLLRIWGHETRTADDGPTALAQAMDFKPDLALLDIGLPGMDGYALAQEIRKIPGLQDVLIVAVSGYGQEEDIRKGRQAGFDVHLVKPVAKVKLWKLTSGELTEAES